MLSLVLKRERTSPRLASLLYRNFDIESLQLNGKTLKVVKKGRLKFISDGLFSKRCIAALLQYHTLYLYCISYGDLNQVNSRSQTS
jgi:hypothetical protein